MKCPYCGHADDRVLDTRIQKDGSIRRRRECLECKARFSTVETIALSYPFIIKKDGRREPYNKEKVQKGTNSTYELHIRRKFVSYYTRHDTGGDRSYK